MKYGAVATGHQLTSETAMSILRAGGNAVDAAIAAYCAACVAEPCMASMASGAFATLFFDDDIHSLDCFCQTPARKISDSNLVPIHVDFGTAQEVYYGGAGAVAVPGIVKGLYELHDKFGSIPMSELFEPARAMAREGVALNTFQQYDLSLLRSAFGMQERGQEIFFKNGKLKQVGDLITLPNFDEFLFVLGKEGEDFFYRGEIARSIEEICVDQGGHLTRDDLSAYKIHWRTPESFYRDVHAIFMSPGPSMGHALFHRMQNRLADVFVLPEPFSNDHLEYLLPGLHGCRDLLNYRQLLFDLAGVNPVQGGKLSGTSHLNVLDNQGNAITLTFSIGEGSGIYVDGTDVHLNNMLGEPALLPEGLDSWECNRRLASMMTPTIITRMGRPLYLLGTGGAERIPVILSLIIHYLLDLDMSLDEAINAPRVYLAKEQLEVEVGFEKGKIIDMLPTRYWDEQSLYFGGVHGIEIDGDKVTAIGDSRREGFAIVE